MASLGGWCGGGGLGAAGDVGGLGLGPGGGVGLGALGGGGELRPGSGGGGWRTSLLGLGPGGGRGLRGAGGNEGNEGKTGGSDDETKYVEQSAKQGSTHILIDTHFSCFAKTGMHCKQLLSDRVLACENMRACPKE